MAQIANVPVECPGCGEEIEIPIDVLATTEVETGTFVLRMQPDSRPMAEHFAAEHAGAEDAEDDGRA